MMPAPSPIPSAAAVSMPALHLFVSSGTPGGEVLRFLAPLSSDYPGFEEWYTQKVIPGATLGTRHILTIKRGSAVVGVGIAKKDSHERKICTVRIAPDFANRGYGLKIFDGLLKWVDTDQPHLTVGEHKLRQFQRIFDWYGFVHTSSVNGKYVAGANELFFNEYS